jgi:hypothetical protein
MAPNERVLCPDRLSRLTPTPVIQSAIADLTVELHVSVFETPMGSDSLHDQPASWRQSLPLPYHH